MKKNKYLIPITISVVFIVGLALRLLLFPDVSRDYTVFLSKWIDAFAKNGLSAAASTKIDYNAPYLVICYLASLCKGWEMIFIKFVSTLFDLFLCAGAFMLVRKLSNTTKAVITTCIIWLLPTVIFNSAWWSQCDSLYVSLCVWSLYLLYCEKREWLGAFLAGVALAFKIQTAFFLGVGAVALGVGKLKLRHLLHFAGGFFAACLPGVLLGYPITRIFTVYGMQVGNPSYTKWMSLNSASIWSVITIENAALLATIITVFAAIGIIVHSFYRENIQKKPINLFDYALLLSCVIPFLLPHMHDRYFYMFEIFAVIGAILYKKYSIAILAQLAGLFVYRGYMSGVDEVWLKRLPFTSSSAAAGCLMAVAVVITAFYCLRQKPGPSKLCEA
jgi:Predicted integral membrane protein